MPSLRHNANLVRYLHHLFRTLLREMETFELSSEGTSLRQIIEVLGLGSLSCYALALAHGPFLTSSTAVSWPICQICNNVSM